MIRMLFCFLNSLCVARFSINAHNLTNPFPRSAGTFPFGDSKWELLLPQSFALGGIHFRRRRPNSANPFALLSDGTNERATQMKAREHFSSNDFLRSDTPPPPDGGAAPQGAAKRGGASKESFEKLYFIYFSIYSCRMRLSSVLGRIFMSSQPRSRVSSTVRSVLKPCETYSFSNSSANFA